jgi:alpha-ribazole phosphatase
MKRCIQTAEILFKETDRPIIIVDALKECSFGEFEYMNYQELNGNQDYQRYIDSGGNAAFPGGESRADFQRRCVEAFKNIIRECTQNKCNGIVAIVAHGGTIMSILDAFALPHKDYFDWKCRNAEGYVAEYKEDYLKITDNI